MTALIPIYIHLFGFTLPDAFRCFRVVSEHWNSSARKLHGINIVDDGIEIPDFKCLKGL
jgi:hypothetical protein